MSSNQVRSLNPFDLLNEDDEGTGALPPPKPKAAPAPKAAAPAAAAAAPAKKQTDNKRTGQNGPRGGANANRAPRAQDQDASVGEKIDRARGDRNTTRGRGVPRGGRGAGPTAHGGNDRKSAGHVDSHKKVEQGWGHENGAAELADEKSGEADAAADVQAVTPGAATPLGAEDAAEKPAAEEKKYERKPVEEEEEDNTQSYAEYLAAKASAAIEGVTALAQRVVGDWEGGGEAVSKKQDNDEALFATKEKARVEKAKKEKKEKIRIEVEGKFAPPGGDRPPRGRGGARGGVSGESRGGFERREQRDGAPSTRGRGGARGSARGARGGAAAAGGAPRAQQAKAVDVNDATAFPSL